MRPDSRRATGARRSPLLRLSLGVLLLIVAPAVAFAHAVVYPKVSAPGAYEKYVLRVPNEKDVATVRVEIRFPAETRISSFGDVAGWKLEVLTDSAKRVVGAVWTGSLAPQRFVEFPFVAVNPKLAGRLVWPAIQTYADGERVEWSGAEGSKAPASVTTVGVAPGEAGRPDADTGSRREVAVGPNAPVPLVPWAALVIALLSLGLSLRRKSDG